MKRACIFFFYDNDGIADEYNFYNLRELKTVCDYLLIVINGRLAPESRIRLADVCDDMFVRKNEGFDAWAYKDGIEYIGYDGLKEYDELILTNNTMYGPLRPLKDVFSETESVKCDFWGLVTNYGSDDPVYLGRVSPWGFKPDAIISNFRVIRSKMLHSIEFRRYWQKLAPVNDYADAVYIGELQFSYDMTNAGFVMYTMDQNTLRNAGPAPSLQMVYEQITELRIPYFRKRLFNSPLKHFTNYKNSTEPAKVMKYIKENTDYDSNLIWQNLIRTVNQYDFHHLLALTEILPSDHSPCKPKGHAAVIFYGTDPENDRKYVRYLNNFPQGTDIYLIADSDENSLLLSDVMSSVSKKYKTDLLLSESVGNIAAALLVAANDIILSEKYDYICFMHDKMQTNKSYECIEESGIETCYDNTACSSYYIENIIALFDADPLIGLISPPSLTHAGYFDNIDGQWNDCYKSVADFLKKNGISLQMHESKPPIAPYESIFWFRPKALSALAAMNYKYSDFDSENDKSTIKQILPYACAYFTQNSGYYPIYAMNNDYARTEMIYYAQSLKRYHTVSIRMNGKKDNATEQIKAYSTDIYNKSNKKKDKKISLDGTFYTKLSRSKLKNIAKAIIPHSIWETIRRKKCEATGEKYYKI